MVLASTPEKCEIRTLKRSNRVSSSILEHTGHGTHLPEERGLLITCVSACPPQRGVINFNIRSCATES